MMRFMLKENNSDIFNKICCQYIRLQVKPLYLMHPELAVAEEDHRILKRRYNV